MSLSDALLDSPGKKVLLTGDEAVARGFIEAGLQLASSYPGRPSIGIMNTLIPASKQYGFYAEWSVNEKVAAEVAIAASLTGARSMVSMKNAGVNVASEPFFAFAYMGAKGGIVLVTGDDIGCHSSNTEQDNRFFARAAYLPIFEPYEPGEAKVMAAAALEYSEAWQIPVMLRITTRISDTSADVKLGRIPKKRNAPLFKREGDRWVDLPQNVMHKRRELIVKMKNIQEAVNKIHFNWLEGEFIPASGGQPGRRNSAGNFLKRTEYGIITSGITYGYVKEALAIMKLTGKVNLLKLATPYPLPERLVERLLISTNNIFVVEETEPFVESQIRGLVNKLQFPNSVYGKELVPTAGELSTMLVLRALTKFMNIPMEFDLSKVTNAQTKVDRLIPERLPMLCPGCGHRPVFFAINVVEKRMAKRKSKKWKDKTSGGIIKPSDIGCYILGSQPPLNAVDTNFCMGASIGIANGFAKTVDNPIVCTIGDSTFFHAGIPPLLNSVFNKANITILILDNSTTAMTGYQPHPGTGCDAAGVPTVKVSIEDLVKACGVEFIKVIDPYKLSDLIAILEDAIKFKGPAVVIPRRICRLLELRELHKRGKRLPRTVRIDNEICNHCMKCINEFGCAAMYIENNNIKIDKTRCNNCGVCTEKEVCSAGAIIKN